MSTYFLNINNKPVIINVRLLAGKVLELIKLKSIFIYAAAIESVFHWENKRSVFLGKFNVFSFKSKTIENILMFVHWVNVVLNLHIIIVLFSFSVIFSVILLTPSYRKFIYQELTLLLKTSKSLPKSINLFFKDFSIHF